MFSVYTNSSNPGTRDISKEPEWYQYGTLNHTLFRNHPEAIFILDLEGKIKMVNEPACSITGIGRDQLMGTHFEWLIYPPYLANTRENFWLVKQQDQTRQFETAIIAEEGVKYLNVTSSPLKVEDKIVAVLGIAKHITERQQKQDLQAYANLLQARNEELEIFRKIIAHDIRKPVANAIGFAKLLDGAALPADREKEVKSLLLRTVESIDTMVRDLNQVIAFKAAGKESKEQVAVLASVKSVLAFFAHDIKHINAAVTLCIEPDLAVFTVAVYFNSILRNLISNALKYHASHRNTTVLVKAVAVSGGVEISVKDNGVGMDMASVSVDLFKMHKRFAPTLADGNGLGLYIVQEQVKLLGGTIAVNSQPDKGTEFIIFLPTETKE